MGNKSEILIREKQTHPSLVVEKDGISYYGRLKKGYTKGKINVQHNNGTNYILVEPRLVDICNGAKVLQYTSKTSNRNASPENSWTDSGNTGYGIFDGYLKLEVKGNVYRGNYDFLHVNTIIYNANDRSKYIRKRHDRGCGSNWRGWFSYEYVLSDYEIDKLGGRNTLIGIKSNMGMNEGNGAPYCEMFFYLRTK